MKGFSGALLALGATLAPPEPQWGDVVLPAALLCPRLRTSYSPRVAWQVQAQHKEIEAEKRPSWSRVWVRGHPESMGLSLARNSDRPARYGLKGLTSNGRKQSYRALSLMEEHRACLAFWTVTLPTEALMQLSLLDSLPKFQDHLRNYLDRYLKSRGLPRWAVGVAELHPARSLREGMPCPHWHVVFMGRKTRGHKWAISREELDGVIGRALVAAGVELPAGVPMDRFLATAGNVQPVKKSVRAYLAKYVTKAGNDTAPWVGTPFEALIPRQWWFWTKEIRLWTLKHLLPIVRDFLIWAHEYRHALDKAGLIRWKQFDLPDPKAPATFEINWLSLEHIAQVIAAWQLDQWDAEWHRNASIRPCQP